MVRVDHISYKIGQASILEDISARFEAGKLNMIIGPNGAGKSTLLKVIGRQLQPDRGSVHYGSMDIKDAATAELARIRAVLSQSTDLAFPLKVAEVVMMGRYPHFIGKPGKRDEIACVDAMQLFDLDAMADRNYMTLSGGEKQRVQFARVLAQIWYPAQGKCRYLFLDEPLTFLDIHYQFDFIHKAVDLLKNEDMVIVGIVHDLNLAAKYADHIVLLHQGRVLASGDRQTVLTKSNIKQAFQLEPMIHEEYGTMFLHFS